MILALAPFAAVGLATGGLNVGHASPASKTIVKHVTMKDSSGSNPFAFSPKTIKIHVGTRVVWTNDSSAPHTVTASNGAFDSGTQNLIKPNKSWSFVFHKVGKYKYTCVLHPYMKGTVIVTK
jgi:plastocyanin